MSRQVLLITAATLLFSCNPKLYRSEMQRDVDDLKITNRQLDERYNSKFDILSDNIAKLSTDVGDMQRRQNQNKADTDVMLEDIKVEFQNLRGTLEETEHKLSIIENQTNRSVSDLDTRLVELENKFDIILGHLTKLQQILDGAKTKTGSSEISEYDKIIKTITKDKDFDAGASQMRAFISKYPSSALADNAQYWLAECFYAKGNYETAIKEFDILLGKYPKSSKTCGALLKKGFSLSRLNSEARSKAVLNEVINKCPNTSEANAAVQKLKEPAKTDKIAPSKISG